MSKNLIEIKKLKKEFKNNNSVVKVLNNVNINIESGKLVALVGPSGSGKSTFLHLLALLDEPTQGKIFLFGNSITNISEDKKNKIIKDYISIIFQNNNLLSDFTALENVAIPLIIRNQNYKNSIEKAKKVLAKVNLSHRLNYFPSDLSGGEQQRVAIARSLAADTKIILADEPTGNLDYKTSNEVFSYFLKLKE
ncbi:MAG: ABC transporter ATP-binding protein, partial [Pelagibacteraceae bacterium]|nr:ABC transporter ATP-binding protein [Pelagibacteraceae bacterium]